MCKTGLLLKAWRLSCGREGNPSNKKGVLDAAVWEPLVWSQPYCVAAGCGLPRLLWTDSCNLLLIGVAVTLTSVGSI